MSLAADAVSGPVLLFDGKCGLCNRVVRLMLRLDQRGAIHFAALQSAPAQAYLRAHGLPTEDFDSLVFIPAWERRSRPEFLLRTDGALAAIRLTGRLGAFFSSLVGWLPASWRDASYRLISRWRYRLFGEWKPRSLPRPEWAQRFLA